MSGIVDKGREGVWRRKEWRRDKALGLDSGEEEVNKAGMVEGRQSG